MSAIPDNYISVDIESASPNPDIGAYDVDRALVAQISQLSVTERKIEPNCPESFFINWTGHPSIDPGLLRQGIDNTRSKMEFDKEGVPTGRKYVVTMEGISGGRDPYRALTNIFNFVKERLDRGYYLVGYNILQFDIPLMFTNFHLVNMPVPVSEIDRLYERCVDRAIDVGVLVKAAVNDMLPLPQDSWDDFFLRAVKLFSRKKWSIEAVAIPSFPSLRDSGIKKGELHDAGMDSIAPHIMLEELRRIHAGR